ncbi:MAG: hypothetical protein ACPGLV_15675 [Bacteroidia bacterium]
MSKLFVVVFVCVIGLFSCGSGNEIKELAQHTEEIEIKKLDSMGTLLKSKTITNKAEIKNLLSVISNAEAPLYKCGFDYELRCKLSNNKFVAIELNSADICAVASFIYNDELMYRYLNKDNLVQLENQLN